LALVSALACGPEQSPPPPPPAAPAQAAPGDAKEDPIPPEVPADPDSRFDRVYAQALDAVAEAVEAELAAVEPAQIATYEAGVAALKRVTPGAHMDRIGATLEAQGIDPHALAQWMETERARVDELAVALETRLAVHQPKVRAIMERTAELAPPEAKAKIQAQLSALAEAPTAETAASPWADVANAEGLREVAARAGADRGVVIDVWATWCAPCMELDRGPMRDEKVLAELARFELVKIDVTDDSPATSVLQERLGAATLPNVLVFDSGDALAAQLAAPKPVDPTTRITTFLSASELHERLQAVTTAR
jgi:thiol-disulfide isomerase/thioredoxin